MSGKSSNQVLLQMSVNLWNDDPYVFWEFVTARNLQLLQDHNPVVLLGEIHGKHGASEVHFNDLLDHVIKNGNEIRILLKYIRTVRYVSDCLWNVDTWDQTYMI
jgi:hypothetical protein